MQDALVESLRAALKDAKWTIDASEESFHGGTTNGELRVLCGLGGRYQSFRDDEAPGADCMPALFAARGATAIGLHGFSGQIFDRLRWWPKIGLTQWLFAQELARDGNLCGEAFQGICDRALIDEAVARLRPGPAFVYALTLNTHLPLRNSSIDPAFEQRCTRLAVPHLPCLLLFKQAALMSDIGTALRASPERPLVVIAGDHVPPFGDVTDRAAFSSTRVPVYILRPAQ